MRGVRKLLFALELVVILGLVGTISASAQVQFFVSASGARPVRAEGLTEAVGTIAFAANSAGVIKAFSTITLDYGAPVEAGTGAVVSSCTTPSSVTAAVIVAGGVNYTVGDVLTVVGGTGTPATLLVTTIAAGAVTSVIVSSAGSYTTTPVNPAPVIGGTGVGAVFILTYSAGGSLTRTYSGSILTLTITGADLTCSAGHSIVVAGVRVNATAAGPGSSINVLVAATVPAAFQATNPITLVSFPPLTVATVQAFPSITVARPTNVKYEVTENFSQAFLSKSDEQGLGGNGFVQDFKIRFAFVGVPPGGVITAVDFTGSDPTLTGLVQTGLPFASQAGAQNVNVDVVIGGTDTTVIEKLVANFTMNVPVSATVSLQGGIVPPEVPRFGSPVIPSPICIDVNPRSGPNLINPNRPGTIPVAILSSSTFDAFANVDKTSLTFGRTGNENSLVFCNGSPGDFNGDGLPDLLCNFDTQKTGFQPGDSCSKLKGMTVDGTPIQETDSVRIAP